MFSYSEERERERERIFNGRMDRERKRQTDENYANAKTKQTKKQVFPLADFALPLIARFSLSLD